MKHKLYFQRRSLLVILVILLLNIPAVASISGIVDTIGDIIRRIFEIPLGLIDLIRRVAEPYINALYFSDYEPQCDYTRAERDAFREAVLTNLRESGKFKGSLFASVRPIGSQDPQGSVLGYNFLFPMGAAPIHRMRYSTDAMLLIYCNPRPPGPAYFSTTFYLIAFSLFGILNGPAAEMGDSLNYLRLNSTANIGFNATTVANESDHPLPWGRMSAVITTPDIDSANDVRSALNEVNFPIDAVNVEVIPSLLDERIDFGLGLRSSLFATQIRFRGWTDVEEAANYSFYFEPVLYLFDGDRTPNPYPTPARLPRGGKESELGLLPFYNELIDLVIQEVEFRGFVYTNRTTMEASPATDPQFCFGDNFSFSRGCQVASQDIFYGLQLGDAPFTPGGLHIVVGVIHSRTGLAEYAAMGFVSRNLNSMDLVGTANDLSELDTSTIVSAFGNTWTSVVENSDKFFVMVVKENCNEEEENGETCLLYEDDGFYVERAALQKSTKTGPIIDDLIPATILFFNPA